MCNAEQHAVLIARLDALETEVSDLATVVAALRSWTEMWPGPREQVAITALMRAELDLYRQAAESAMRELAQVLRSELAALRGGMTEGAQDAFADMGTKMQLVVDLHRRSQDNQAAILSRLDHMAATQDQGATFDASVERLVSTYQSLWEAQKAEADAARAAEEAQRAQSAQDDAQEKAARLARERRKAARDARIYKLATAVAVPVLMSAVGTPLAVLTSLSGTLPPRFVVALSVLVLLLGCSFSVYWGVVRQPPAEPETEERSVDHLPPPPPPPATPADGAGSSVTTTTTTTTTPAP